MVISARRQKHLLPLPLPLRCTTVLCFAASVRLVCGTQPGWSKQNKPSTDSKCRAIGDNYPAHNRPVFRWLLVSILRSGEIPFLGSRKKTETQNSHVLLTSLLTTVPFVSLCNVWCWVVITVTAESRLAAVYAMLNYFSLHLVDWQTPVIVLPITQMSSWRTAPFLWSAALPLHSCMCVYAVSAITGWVVDRSNLFI